MQDRKLLLSLAVVCAYVMTARLPVLAAPIRMANVNLATLSSKAPALLYATESAGTVSVWEVDHSDRQPIATIVGFVQAEGLAVDNKQNLYVADRAGKAVTVFHRGATTPFLTLTQGLDSPSSVAVGNDGTVYVADEAGFVEVYPRGSQNPSQSLNAGLTLMGVAVDGANNVFVMFFDGCCGGVGEFAAGSSTFTYLFDSEQGTYFTWGLTQNRKGDFVLPLTKYPQLNGEGDCAIYSVSGSLIGGFGTRDYIYGAAAFNKEGNRLYIAGLGGVASYAIVNGRHSKITGFYPGNFYDAIGVALSPRMPLPQN